MQPANIEAIFASGGAQQHLSPHAPSDAILADMARINALPPAEKFEALEPYLEGWQSRRKDPVEIAYYLAAAGLTFDEACALNQSVQTRAREHLRLRARHDIIRGVALLAAGVVSLILGVCIDPHFPAWGIVLLLCAIGGATMLVRGLRLQRRITPLSDEVLERDHF